MGLRPQRLRPFLRRGRLPPASPPAKHTGLLEKGPWEGRIRSRRAEVDNGLDDGPAVVGPCRSALPHQVLPAPMLVDIRAL